MDEIKALREEVAKLRERIAVLEASRQSPVPHLHFQQFPQHPQWVYPNTSIQPYIAPNPITC